MLDNIILFLSFFYKKKVEYQLGLSADCFQFLKMRLFLRFIVIHLGWKSTKLETKEKIKSFYKLLLFIYMQGNHKVLPLEKEGWTCLISKSGKLSRPRSQVRQKKHTTY